MRRSPLNVPQDLNPQGRTLPPEKGAGLPDVRVRDPDHPGEKTAGDFNYLLLFLNEELLTYVFFFHFHDPLLSHLNITSQV